MDPRYYHGSYHSSHGDHDFSGFYADHHPYDQYPYDPTYQATAMLSTQNPTTLWDIKYNLRQLPAPNPTTSSFNTMSSCVSEGNYSIVRSQTTGIYPAPPQPIHLADMERVRQASYPDTLSGSGEGMDPRIHDCPTPRRLVPQQTYKPARQQGEPGGPQAIEFFVHGEKGIRLSDALEGNWGGFEDRDDRLLFSDDRLQIIIRLQVVGCPPWQSKIFTTDHTVRRQPITRTKLAYEVAKNVRKFLEREKAKGHANHTRCSWKDASLENMYLTRLVRVSNASWQPEVFVGQQPIVTTSVSSPPA